MGKDKSLAIDENLVWLNRPQIESSLKTKIVKVTPLHGGKNSQVYCLENAARTKFLIKFYHRSLSDNRNRLDVEFNAFDYLRSKRLKTVPKPLIRHEQAGFAIYEYVDGKKIDRTKLTKKYLQTAVDFLVHLKKLADKEDGHRFGEASEARFSFKEVVENINQRLMRLEAIEEKTAMLQKLEKFIKNDFIPLRNDVVLYIKDKMGRDFERPLAKAQRTLSPSDFGFHNALVSPKGIVFVDFEYFGWDDPSKMVSDFLWHPAMDLTLLQKKYFFQSIVEQWPDQKWLANRVRFAFPLFGLKWCMIFLNEFIKSDAARRAFASGKVADNNQLLQKQLNKARRYLSTINKTYRKFPYA